MLEAVLIVIAVLGVGFGVGCLLWARRAVAEAREDAARARRELAASSLERRLIGSGRAVKKVLQTAARVREHGPVGAFLGSLEELAGWAEVARPDLRRIAARDGTVTILFSDIEDSTATNERLGDRAWVRVLEGHDRIVRNRVDAHHGYLVKSQGDGFMVAFSQPADAVRCAVDIQRALAGENRRLFKEPIAVRIGIHLGKAVEKQGDLFGRNVAMAARVAAESQGGQVLVSSVVAERAGELPDIKFVRPRDVELKGLPGEHELFEVEW